MSKPFEEAKSNWSVALAILSAGIVGMGIWYGVYRYSLTQTEIPKLIEAVGTAGLSLADLIHVRPPSEAILTAQFLIGMGIGTGYVGVTLAELRRDVAAGGVFVVILAVLAAVFTEIVVFFELARPVEGFLAFAPGGQAEMTILAIIVGADLGFVIVHHLVRLLVVITGAPIAARFFGVGR